MVNKNNKKSSESTVSLFEVSKGSMGVVILIIILLVLSLLDMFLLLDALQKLSDMDDASAAAFALAIPFMGSFFAAHLGWDVAKKKHLSNQKLALFKNIFFYIWLAIGFIMLSIRATIIISDIVEEGFVEDITLIAYEFIMMILLLVLYAGTGYGIYSQFKILYKRGRDSVFIDHMRRTREINRKLRDEARAQKLLKKSNSLIHKIESDITALEEFSNNYDTLQRQYSEKRSAIEKSELSTGHTIAAEVHALPESFYLDSDTVRGTIERAMLSGHKLKDVDLNIIDGKD